MNTKHSFTAVIKNARGGGAFVEIPFEVETAFGSKKPRVKATIDGIPYRGTLVRMGTECHILGILKSIREQIEKQPGDRVAVSVELDTQPRVVEVPPDLKKAFKYEKEAEAAFEKLSYTHQREYVQWINEAKKYETRQRRILKIVEMLKKGEKAR